jgi:HTH-type transcriptional regulator / antitoxin HigA
MTTLTSEKYATEIATPKVIASDAQNREYLKILVRLREQERLSVAEENFADVLTLLIKDYESKRYPIGKARPLEVLHELVDANGLQPKDLIPVFGSKGAVSDALNGKRPFSKNHISRLSKMFNVSHSVFF